MANRQEKKRLGLLEMAAIATILTFVITLLAYVGFKAVQPQSATGVRRESRPLTAHHSPSDQGMEPESPHPKAYEDTVLHVVVGESDLRTLVEDLGLQYEASVSVPEPLRPYRCVILSNANAVRPETIDRLKEYLVGGGGLVLSGDLPARLAKGSTSTSNADWFGCHEITVLGGDFYGGNYIRAVDRWCITAYTNSPLGTQIKGRSTLFACTSDTEPFAAEEPDEFCEIMAVWSPDGQVEEAGGGLIAAFVHPYGKGWVYWQSLIDHPNYPRLKSLFRAGIRRVTTKPNLDTE